MGHRCCSKQKVKRGLWSPEEDERLVNYITTHGHGSWSSVPKLAGLQRCGKSCRLRWINYLRPDLKRGTFSSEEEQIIIDVHRILGNRWAQIAKHLPGRTDNEVKNFWNSCIKKKLMAHGLDPRTHNLIPARLRSHHRTTTTTTSNIGHDDYINGDNQRPFSIITVKDPITYNIPESDPPASSSIYFPATSSSHPRNSNMVWTDHGFPASWEPVVDSEVQVQSHPGYGLLVEGGRVSSAPPTTIIQMQERDPPGGPYNYTAAAEEEEEEVVVSDQHPGCISRDIRVEEQEEIGTGTMMSSFDCFDLVDPSFLSCRDLTSMDIIDLPWNF